MKWAKDHSRMWYAVMCAALATLIPLAWMQYRLINQMSDAENERMHVHLNSAVQRLSRDFESEIGRIARVLMTGPSAPPEMDTEDLGTRYTRWQEADANHQIVRDLYIAHAAEDDNIELSRFNPKENVFEPCAWPARLESLRARLRSDGPAPFLQSLADDAPAIVTPRWRHRGPGGEFGTEASWAIAEIDLAYIKTEFLPELVKKNLPREGSLDYQVRVVKRGNPGQVLYVSDATLPADFFASVDSQTPLLFSRPGMWSFRSQAAGDGGPDRERPRERRPRGDRDRAGFGMGFGGPGPRSGHGPGHGPGPGPERGSGPGPGPSMDGPPPREFADTRGWLLQVKHRAGSLEEAVAQARRRNLGISFAILLIMGGTLLMLLVSTRRAQQLAKLQMEFVAGVSHELRTPLSVICSAGDNLADGVVGSEQQIRRYGSVIRNEGRRLSQMVEQILGFAGIQSGRLKYEMLQPVDVGQMITRAMNACEPEILASGCELETRIEPNLPLVSGDPISLTHCLRNLIDNAARYGRAGDWIGVFAKTASGARGTEIEIRIEDHGPGIEPREMARIFDPFYRGQKSVEDQIHGFGLGLALAKRIVVAHSGAISVDSTPGKGTAFTIRIPANVQVVESTEITAIAGTEYGGTAHSAD